LGLNLANLKKDKGIVDYHDEFMAKMDEFSESWREAMRKEKRF
jgi:flagellin-specific chaperone FliS